VEVVSLDDVVRIECKLRDQIADELVGALNLKVQDLIGE
jgi:hypothetical protein